MDPKQSHSNSKILNSRYRRNLLTRQTSTDKNFFESALSPPEAPRQKQYPSEITDNSDINIISDDTMSNSIAHLPVFEKSNQKEISQNSSNQDQMSYVTVRKKCKSRNNSTSSFNISESHSRNMGSENEHSDTNCKNGHNNQSVYVLFPKNQKNSVKIEELNMFISDSRSSKRTILNEFSNQENPCTNFSSTSNLNLKNNQAISARRFSPFSRILEKSLIRLD